LTARNAQGNQRRRDMNEVEQKALRRAEYAVCGAVMNGKLEEVKGRGITFRSFYFPAPRRVFKMVERLASDGKATDALAVIDALVAEKEDRLDGAPPDEAIFEMGDAYTTDALLPAFCETVEKGRKQRDERDAARRLASALEEGDAGEQEAARRRLVEVQANGQDGLVFVSDEALSAQPSIPPEPIVEGMIDRGEVGLLAAPAKFGKSFFLLQMAKCVGAGKPFLGRKTKRGWVVYVNAEVGKTAWKRRSDAVNEALKISHSQILHVSTRGNRNVTLATLPMQIKSLLKERNVKDVGLIVIDPFYALVGDKMDENNADDVKRVFFDLQRLAEELNCAVMVAHHTGKGKVELRASNDHARGSSAFVGSADSFFSLVPHTEPGVVTFGGGRRNGDKPEQRHLQFLYPLWVDMGEAAMSGKNGPGRRPTIDPLDIPKAFPTPEAVLKRADFIKHFSGDGSSAVDRALKKAQPNILKHTPRGYQLTPPFAEQRRREIADNDESGTR
jgi:hypothetical protein